MSTRRQAAAGPAFACVLLAVAAPTPAAALRTLRAADAAAEQTAPLVALLALAAWSLAGWLGAVVALIAGSRLPGRAGRLLSAAARRAAPAAVRRTVEAALGLTVALGVLAAPAAAAAAPAPAVPAAPSLDWSTHPATAPPAPSTSTAPTPALAPTGPSPGPTPLPTSAPVVVRPGDTLWALAEQHLRDRGVAAPSDPQVALAWPSWWAANREAIGPDPHLLLPGTPLAPPEAPLTR